MLISQITYKFLSWPFEGVKNRVSSTSSLLRIFFPVCMMYCPMRYSAVFSFKKHFNTVLSGILRHLNLSGHCKYSTVR